MDGITKHTIDGNVYINAKDIKKIDSMEIFFLLSKKMNNVGFFSTFDYPT